MPGTASGPRSPAAPSTDLTTDGPGPGPGLRRDRIVGIDAARAVALIGMMAVHLFPIVDDDGTPSLAWALFAGRAFALFVFLAGVGLALTTGGPRPPVAGARAAATSAVAARALVVFLIGLVLGHFVEGIDVILAFYGLLFLLAVPVLTLTPPVLAGLAGGIVLVVPFVMQWSRDLLPEPLYTNPSFARLDRPLTLLGELLLTGVYPALPLLAYVCGGLAVGRLLAAVASDPVRLRVLASRLLGLGLALALVAWIGSGVLLHEVGGLDHLAEANPELDDEGINDVLLWGPDPTLPTTTHWWLAIRAPHSSTPFDLAHTLGTSMAALGLALLVCQRGPGVFRPLVATGAMTLTLYSAHVLVAETGLFASQPGLAFVTQVGAAVAVAAWWRERLGQGPLERLVATAARLAREATTAGARSRVGAGRG